MCVCRVAANDAVANGRHRIRPPVYSGAICGRAVGDSETGKLAGLVLRARERNDGTGRAAVDDRRIDDVRVLGVLRTQHEVLAAEVDVLIVGPRMDDYGVVLIHTVNRVLDRRKVARPVLINVILRRMKPNARQRQNAKSRQNGRKQPHILALPSKARLQVAEVRWAGELGVRNQNYARCVPAHRATHKAINGI